MSVTGHMLYAAGGRRLAPVYRVLADGSPQLILDGRLVTVPASTLVRSRRQGLDQPDRVAQLAR